jgi:hypothetical protein
MRRSFSFDVLSDGSLVLRLGDGCVETTARRAHHELAAALLEERAAGPAMEAMVDLLAGFLGATDFPALRAAHRELSGGVECRVRLHRRGDGLVRWEIVGARHGHSAS